MQIRSQYLIQDNHNDYTSEASPFSRAQYLPPLVYTRVRPFRRPMPDTYLPTYSPPFGIGTHAYPFHPLSRPRPRRRPCLPSLARSWCCTLGSWKCLDAPRRPAGSRGKNATLLIIKYARDAVSEGGRDGRGRGGCVIRGCTVWFGSTSPERSTKEFPAGGNFNEF